MGAFLSKQKLADFIRSRHFSDLFIELGWDTEHLPQEPLVLEPGDGESFCINRVAEKRGFVVCVCDASENYPATKTQRRRLINQLARHHYEHLLIICGEGRQCWTVAIRPQNRPLRTVEVEWSESQDIQPLMEKLDGMIFDISEEEGLAITDVVDRVRGAFMANSETVTRRFYGEFQNELREFSDFIQGMENTVSREWYAALMLNRLMFIYFIQRKEFLDGDSNYLENRLNSTQKQFGRDEFDRRFYRHFLRKLFSEGLGTPEEKRTPELRALLGKVPYLNGGLFDVHEIEKENKDIQIPDRAFEKLFAFFGKYNWHLDTRATATGRDINPDVIGYIFEKYINDRAAMGAYYTQEDITGYISRNTIIPSLLNHASEKCKNAFDPQNGIWRFLRENPDHYIYAAVSKGCDIPDEEIPENIRCGMDTQAPGLLERRKDWNTKTEQRFALPTEIWRETMARRQRYFALKAKIENGEIYRIDDLITHNLDIERFASDALRYYEGSDFIAAFYAAIAGRKALQSNRKETRGITVLDPACGSGAFLFAALNVLEPLYEQCINRMEDFIGEDDSLREQGKRKGRKKHPQFRTVMDDIAQHPNRKYWIYKTIILNNLYGVDLMKEATEIAKLRLFLKLAAEAEYDQSRDNLGLEPLPDIDFNIRSGNSLVGFASMQQFEKLVELDPHTGQQRLDYGSLTDEVREQATEVETANAAFRDAQDGSSDEYQNAKQGLQQRLDILNDRMNRYLAEEYGIDTERKRNYERWLESHQPFNWLAEFYGIIEQDGGFDVVIGNPPYVKARKVNYSVENDNYSSPDIYGYMIEKSINVLNEEGYMGQIIMHNIAFSKDFSDVRANLVELPSLWFSFYGRIPSGLFSADTRVRNAIVIATRKISNPSFYTTRLHRWNAIQRDILFPLLSYTSFEKNSVIPMFNDEVESAFWQTNTFPFLSLYNQKHSRNVIHFKKVAYNWISVGFTPPPAYDTSGNSIEQSEVGRLCFVDDKLLQLVLLLFSGRMFFAYWLVYGDEFHVTTKLFLNFRLPLKSIENRDLKILYGLAQELESRLSSVVQFKMNSGRKVGSYNTQKLWSITDKSDMIFLRYMTEMPELFFESVCCHTSQTIMTEKEENGEKHKDH